MGGVNEAFHLWARGVPPVGTPCSTCGNEVFHLWEHNHGFHGSTMESMEQASTSPLWGLVAAVWP